MERNETAFPKLRHSDIEDPSGEDVIEAKVHSFGDSEAGGGNQSNQGGIGFFPEETIPKLTGRSNEPGNLFRRIDIRQRPSVSVPKRVHGRNFVRLILGMKRPSH
jgi:hypothetical protein